MYIALYVAAAIVAAFLTFGVFVALPQVWMYVLVILNLIFVLLGAAQGYRGSHPTV
jgi:hypothetical protein